MSIFIENDWIIWTHSGSGEAETFSEDHLICASTEIG